MNSSLANGDGLVEFFREGDAFRLAIDLGDEGGYREFEVSRLEVETLAAELEMLLDDRFQWEEFAAVAKEENDG